MILVSFCDFMQRVYSAGNDNVFVVNEDKFRTSQVCSRCWRHAQPRGMQQVPAVPCTWGAKAAGAKSPCWKLKTCVSGHDCRNNLVVDRDVNAARNITAVLLEHFL
jgi:hypothetical protein